MVETICLKLMSPLDEYHTGGLERTGQERIGRRWKEPDKTLPTHNIGKSQKLTIKHRL